MKIFQTNIRYLGHQINIGTIISNEKSVQFASKFSDEIYDKTQLQSY